MKILTLVSLDYDYCDGVENEIIEDDNEAQLKYEILKEAGYDVFLESPKQLDLQIYDLLTISYNIKTDSYTTDASKTSVEILDYEHMWTNEARIIHDIRFCANSQKQVDRVIGKIKEKLKEYTIFRRVLIPNSLIDSNIVEFKLGLDDYVANLETDELQIKHTHYYLDGKKVRPTFSGLPYEIKFSYESADDRLK